MGACPCSNKKDAPFEDVTAGPTVDQPNLPLKLIVFIVGARGVRRGDWFPGADSSECYCLLKLGEEVIHKTGDQQESVEPLWNEEIQVDYYPGESLDFSIWDSLTTDTKMPEGSRNRLVGRFVMPSTMFEHDGFNGELQLENLGRNISSAYLSVKIRLQDQDYPDGLGPEFNVNLAKDPKAPMGLDYDTHDENMVYIADVKPGPIQFHNLNAKPTHQLRSGQFVVEANGFTGQAQQLYEVMKKDSILDLIVRRSYEMTVAIDKKSKKAPIGMDFPKVSGNNLMILDITDGPVYEWNATNPQLEVKCGDRIVAVNAYRGKASELLKMMKNLERFQLTIVRPVSLD